VQVVADRVARLRDGRSLGYAQYGTDDGVAIVNAHGGRMIAAQRPEGGAHFEFTLPTAEGAT